MVLKKNPSVFYKTFVGEYLVITTNVTTNQIMMTEEGPYPIPQQLLFEGFLLEEDDEFYYLGNSKEVDKSVKKEIVVSAEVQEPKTLGDHLLDSLEETDEGMN